MVHRSGLRVRKGHIPERLWTVPTPPIGEVGFTAVRVPTVLARRERGVLKMSAQLWRRYFPVALLRRGVPPH